MVTLSLSETLASMSDDDIMALVGPATWANGLRLEHAGAVRELSWNQDGNLLEARVKEAGLTYRAWISQGAIRPSLKCACALRTDCPHAAAALIAGRAEALKRQESVPEWSRVLKQVLGGIRERSGEPLALVIDAHDPAVEAALIPLRRGSSFAWTTKRASWLDLTATQWASVTDGLDPTHVSLLREGYRLSRESRSWHSRGWSALCAQGWNFLFRRMGVSPSCCRMRRGMPILMWWLRRRVWRFASWRATGIRYWHPRVLIVRLGCFSWMGGRVRRALRGWMRWRVFHWIGLSLCLRRMWRSFVRRGYHRCVGVSS